MKKSMLALAACAALAPEFARAATFTVTNTAGSGAGSLAQAIADANATTDPDLIEFNIPGGGVKTISGVLPAIVQPVSILGFTQPGAHGRTLAGESATDALVLIELDGAQVPSQGSVLRIQAGPTFVRGIAIRGIKAQTAGIVITEDVTDAEVSSCFVGTNAAGTQDQSAGTGIRVFGTAQIGGATFSSMNLISGNNAAGVELRGPGSQVLFNLIGTDATGSPSLGNGQGVRIAEATATGNVVGAPSFPNTIAGNSGNGIVLQPDAGSGNTLAANRIFENGGLGIDLGADGPTPNDPTDSDEGPNRLLNAPELSMARINGDKLNVLGAVRVPNGTYGVQVYLGSAPGSSGFGEGQFPLTSGLGFSVSGVVARIDATFTLVEAPSEDLWVTAVVTGADGSSSEFSRAVMAPQAGSILTVTNAGDSGAGSLREALAAAAANADKNTIVFEIPGKGPHEIALATPLLATGGPVLVDGYSQDGAATNTLLEGSDAVPGVILDGSALDSVPVLTVENAPAILRGLSVVRGPRDGVRFDFAGVSVVEGCLFGVDQDQVDGDGNGWFGLSSFGSTGMIVGGPNVGQRNVIAGNGLGGFQCWSNAIGLFNNAIGLEDVLSQGSGVLLAMDDAVIGADPDGWGNVIAHNYGAGIALGAGATGNDIRGNRIFGNGALGIDIIDDVYGKVTENDVDDVDTGANDRQNFPVLDSVTTADGALTVAGSLDVPPDRLNTAYKLRLFSNAACDESGHGQGEEFLGAIDIVVGSDESFGAIVPAVVAPFRQVTATVTDPATSNTSEFSACVTALPDVVVCGDATSDGKVLASDALAVLKAAVGSFTCATCVCDANGSGSVLAGDAQLVLRAAVGQSVTLACPPCN